MSYFISFILQILNFRFGSFALVLSRKYAYGMIATFVIIFTYFKLTSEPSTGIDEIVEMKCNLNIIIKELINVFW